MWPFTDPDDEAVDQTAARALAEAEPPTLWLLGKTGAGKTSIVHELTGSEAAEIGNGFAPCTQTAARYDFPDSEAPVLRFLDTRGLGETDYDPAADLAAFGDRTHLTVLVVRAADQSLDQVVKTARAIRSQRPSRPTLLVLTCLHEAAGGDVSDEAWGQSSERPLPPESQPELRRLVAAQYDRFEGLFDRAVLVDLTPLEWGLADPRFGHEALRRAILDLMPQAQRQATRVALHETAAGGEAPHAHIIGYATAAAGAAAVPIPLIDLPAVASLQWKLTRDIAARHQQSFDRAARQRLAGLIGGRAVIGLAVRGLLKAVPVVGSAVNAAAAFAATYGAGMAADAYFAAMATDPAHAPNAAELRAIYDAQLKRAMTLWRVGEE